MIRAIIFDCFGVLATEAWLPFKAEYFSHDPGLMRQVTDISHQADQGIISRQEAINKTADLAGITPQEFQQAIGGNVPNQELFDYIRELKPKFKIGFLSNISDDYLHKIFTDDHLALFDCLEMSYKSGVIKPEAGAYLNAAKSLGVKPAESVMVDDQPRNVDGARRAGMQAILYQDVTQLRSELGKLT